MLVLGRKVTQEILINDNIRVSVLDIKLHGRTIYGAEVRLGIEAPKDVPIMRTELVGLLGDDVIHCRKDMAGDG